MVKQLELQDPSKQDKNTSGFTMDIIMDVPTQEQIAVTELALTQDLASFLVDRLKKEVPELISYTDFFGEAENFLRETNQSWIYRKDVAKTMYTNFLDALEESAYFDTESQCIMLKTKYLTSFGHGDYYSPAYEIIQKLLLRWIAEGEKQAVDANKKI